MVAEIRAWKTFDGEIFNSEEDARKYELENALYNAMSDAGISHDKASAAATILVNNNFEEIYELVVAYKKTLPANAIAKEGKQGESK